MASFGVLPSGEELWLNRLAAEADPVVAEGFIEPHFFAGFPTVGRRSFPASRPDARSPCASEPFRLSPRQEELPASAIPTVGPQETAPADALESASRREASLSRASVSIG